MKRKREEYIECISRYYDTDTEKSDQEQEMLRQILVDMPRTAPNIPLFHHEIIQKSMERMLYIWALRHPATRYVQGMNDIITPFYIVFFADTIGDIKSTVSYDINKLDEKIILGVESDTYWCFSKLIDGIQDHYTFDQSGIQKCISQLEEIIQRMDAPLYKHITESGIEFIQFSFRWFNCFLLRDLPLKSIVRFWDTFLCEDNGFETYHVYICANFLLSFSNQLKEMAFQEMMLFLQDPPTGSFDDKSEETLISQAFILKNMFSK